MERNIARPVHARDVVGRHIDLQGHRIYLEKSGEGDRYVVFEAGLGFGRTSWDPVVALLRSTARTIAYDRIGHGLSDPGTGATTIEEMAGMLRDLVAATVPRTFVLVAHSMGALIARAAAPSLAPQLDGLVLVDPTPEDAAMFDDLARLTRQQDRLYRTFELVSHFPPLGRLVARIGAGPYRARWPDTYDAIVREDSRPSSFAQMRREAAARADAIAAFRRSPPQSPRCPVILLSANRAARGSGAYLADIQERQRRYVASLGDARFELVDASHVIQAAQPELVVARIREVLGPTSS